VDTESDPLPSPTASERRIGFVGTFVSPALEHAFRQRRFREDTWLTCFLVVAAMLRVSLFVLADYQHFGLGPAFWPLLSGRLLFLLASACALLALRRAASPETADLIFFGWGCLLGCLTVASLSARPPSNTGLLLMSFSVVLMAYCVTPLPLPRQAMLALGYSAAVLGVCRHVDGVTLGTVGAIHALSNLFGAVTSWRLNHRRRQAFLSSQREAELRASLETAAAEIRTLRGLLCICAWCKRIRDEATVWQTVETFVQSRTHASFTHGICPNCLQSQEREFARLTCR
jgi:hypothetical protein